MENERDFTLEERAIKIQLLQNEANLVCKVPQRNYDFDNSHISYLEEAKVRLKEQHPMLRKVDEDYEVWGKVS